MKRFIGIVGIILALCIGIGSAAAQTSGTAPQLRYAGSVPLAGAPGKALALVFTHSFAPHSHFSNFIIVIDGQGNHVGGHWQVASRHNVLLFRVPGPGTYHVILTPGLRTAKGDTLRTRYSGQLTVH